MEKMCKQCQLCQVLVNNLYEAARIKLPTCIILNGANASKFIKLFSTSCRGVLHTPGCDILLCGRMQYAPTGLR